MSKIGDYIIEQEERAAVLRSINPYDLQMSTERVALYNEVLTAYREYEKNEETNQG